MSFFEWNNGSVTRKKQVFDVSSTGEEQVMVLVRLFAPIFQGLVLKKAIQPQRCRLCPGRGGTRSDVCSMWRVRPALL